MPGEIRRLSDAVLLTGDAIPAALYAVDYTIAHQAQRGERPRRSLEALREILAPPGHGANPEAPQEESGDSPELVTSEVAGVLGISTRTVRRKASQLGGRLVGGRLLFDRLAVLEHKAGSEEA